MQNARDGGYPYIDFGNMGEPYAVSRLCPVRTATWYVCRTWMLYDAFVGMARLKMMTAAEFVMGEMS